MENSGSEDPPRSRRFSFLRTLPCGLVGTAPALRRYSDKSGTNSCSTSNNHDIPATLMIKKRHIDDRSINKDDGTGKSLKTRSTLSTGMSSGSGAYSPTVKSAPRNVLYGRWLFFVLLLMVASTLGFLTHHLLSTNETYLAECVFLKVASHAIETIRAKQLKKKYGMDTMGSVLGSTGSETEQWPYVTQFYYEAIANDVIETSNGCNIGYGPILTPMQVPEFEAYAADFYQNTRLPEPFPNGTAVKFGKGVSMWSKDFIDGETPYHDLSGETSWDSKRRIVTPIFQYSSGVSSKLMYNMHSSPTMGKAIEDMMTCAEETKELIIEYDEKILEGIEESEVISSVPSLKDCTVVTDIGMNTSSTIQGRPRGPGASMLQPIFPANDKTKMVGVMLTTINWYEILYDVFSENVDGIDVVLSTPTQQVTYRIINGTPVLQGPGDLHDPKYDDIKSLDGEITPSKYFASQSVPYTASFYPREDLFKLYATKNPYYATIGAICIMVFTVLMFLSYDFLVQREFNAKHELLKAKRHFMRYVSHEVRTPLNSVCMGLNLMQEEIQAKLAGPHSDDSRDALITVDEAQAWLSLSRDVHISAQSATNVLNDFLNYDKIESRQLTLELSVIPIQELINQTVSEFVLPAQDKSINMSVLREKLTSESVMKKKHSRKSFNDNIDDIESQLIEGQVVVGDKARLSQVVRNVLSNAIKFTPEKGQITVKTTWMVASVGESTNVNLQDGTTEALYQTGWIQLEVIDTGPGMTEDQLATVFESGVQFNANKNQKGGGSGLGLFIAKGIVDQHNGALTVDSEGLGKGTTFVCKLPVYCKPKLQKSDRIFIDPRDESVTERVASSWLDNHDEKDLCYRILVVDDAPMNRKLLTRLLLKRGHEVDMAEDGLQAHDMVAAEMKKGKRYDTILMDFQMPVMDGPTATQKIRSIGCDSFIVGITGNVLPQDIEYFKMCGADGVLGKPFQVEELESMWIEYGVTSG